MKNKSMFNNFVYGFSSETENREGDEYMLDFGRVCWEYIVDFGKSKSFLDDLKEYGFKFATLSGLSISMEDLSIPPQKREILKGAEKRSKIVNERFEKGAITREEKRQSDIDIWINAQEELTDKMLDNFYE